MSIRRLCVRISYWSRASLSPCGETSTVKRSILVGSGTGPLTVAPVRFQADADVLIRSHVVSRSAGGVWTRRRLLNRLLEDLGHDAGADRLTAFTDGEAQAFFHRDRRDQLHHHLDVVARHDHLNAFR